MAYNNNILPENQNPSENSQQNTNNIQNIKLTKKVFSNKISNELLQKRFDKLAKSDDPINEEKIKEIYDNIFYIISKIGKYSHKNIVEQSYDFINFSYNKTLDSTIKNLSQNISTKDGEKNRIENPVTETNTIYENGALLTAGENGQSFTASNTIWIMQEGKKRAFSNLEILNTTKKALGLPTNLYDGRYYISYNELNNIPNGKDIAILSDLNLKGEDLFPEGEMPVLLGSSAYYDVEFECKGNEISDFTEAISTQNVDVSTLQFYLNNDSCTIKYIKDEFTNDETGPEIISLNIEKGQKSTIRLLRSSNLGDNNIPNNMSLYYDESGYNDITNITYNGNDIVNYEKLWGPGSEYPSVTYAEGRILSKEIEDNYLTNTLLMPQNTDLRIFNGLPTNATGAWTTSPNINILDDPGYLGQELSNYGTKRIYPSGQGLYGSLNQNSDIQSSIFDDMDNIYYIPTYNGQKVYGQPIIRYDNDYLVLLDCYKQNLTRYFQLLRLRNNSVFKKRRGQFSDATGLQMDYNSNTIYGVKWDTISKSRIKFIGLQEYKTNEHVVSENYFNPINGSNFELNGINSL